MSTPLSKRGELAELMGALRDGLSTPEQASRLDRLIATDSEVQEDYLDYIQLHAMLRHNQEFSSLGGGDGGALGISVQGPVIESRDRARLRRGRAGGRIARYAAASVAVLVVVVGGAYLVHRESQQVSVAVKKTEAVGAVEISPGKEVAVLTRAVDAVWGPMTLPTAVGSGLPQGRMRLTSGLAQLEFYRGAIVVLEGPADLELLGTDRALCRQGKLRVRASSQSSKFSVETPNADVIDLGTEFGVRVDEAGGSEVRVFEGKVELHGRGPGPAWTVARELAEGQVAQLDPAGVLHEHVAGHESYVGPMELDRRSSTEALHRYNAWAELSRKIRADPSVILYFSFEGQQQWDRTLRGQGVGGPARLDGAIVGCRWVEGRWPGKAALDFKRPSDRVRVHVSGIFETLTLMTWVRVDGFDRLFSSLLLSDGWDKPGVSHWQLEQGGHLKFGINSGPKHRSPAVLSPSKLGLWTNLATVMDAGNRSITHYVDGQAVSNCEIPSGVRAEVGWAEIGNWDFPLPSDSEPIRNLNGRMDEFILFSRALDAREIRAMYEAGKPDS